MANGSDVTRHGVWATDVEMKAARQYDVWRRTGDDAGHDNVDELAVVAVRMRPEPRKGREQDASMLKHEQHSHHQVERVEELPQHIVDWVSGGIVPCIYCV